MAGIAVKQHGAAAKVPGKPFVKGDPRINREGRPKGRTVKEALIAALAAEGVTGASNADEIADALIEMVVKRRDLGALDRIIALTEEVKVDEPNTTKLLIALDK